MRHRVGDVWMVPEAKMREFISKGWVSQARYDAGCFYAEEIIGPGSKPGYVSVLQVRANGHVKTRGEAFKSDHKDKPFVQEAGMGGIRRFCEQIAWGIGSTFDDGTA